MSSKKRVRLYQNIDLVDKRTRKWEQKNKIRRDKEKRKKEKREIRQNGVMKFRN